MFACAVAGVRRNTIIRPASAKPSQKRVDGNAEAPSELVSPEDRRSAMENGMQSWRIGWIAATIALVAAALLAIDIAAHRGETLGDVFGATTPAAPQTTTVRGT
jgi:anti-sigma-K factor RskA